MSSKNVKNLLIQRSGYKCSICNISEWRSKPICLELDHIDGNNSNNEQHNLRLLCPNCHSQTETFRGRNIHRLNNVSDEDLLNALMSTKNIRQALLKVGLTPKGANYKRASNLLNISYSTPIDISNSQYGTKWINNGKINKKVKQDSVDEFISLGWFLGRIFNNNHRPPHHKGKIWITNGIQDRLVEGLSNFDEGWWKGRSFVK